MLSSRGRALVVVAHPDDEALGCGAVLHRLSKVGMDVGILILTEGCSTQYPGEEYRIEQKESQGIQAAQILGAEVHFARLPDMELSSLPMAQVTSPVSGFLEEFNPDVVFTHSLADLNSDHRVTHEAVRIATRPGMTSVRGVVTCEVLSSTEVGMLAFRPQLFLPVRNVDVEAKVAALGCYAGEVRVFPHPRSPEGIRHLAAYRGMQAGTHQAEAFEIIWWREPPSWLEG